MNVSGRERALPLPGGEGRGDGERSLKFYTLHSEFCIPDGGERSLIQAEVHGEEVICSCFH